MARRLTTPTVVKFIFEHGLDHSLLSELEASRIEDVKLRKMWAKAHTHMVEMLTYLGIAEDYRV